jgi:RNA-directed DNA polymerase
VRAGFRTVNEGMVAFRRPPCYFSMQLSLFDSVNEDRLLTDLFQAYFNARKNKRNTINALAFEKHLESNIFELFDEILGGEYEPSKSICFIVDRPVKREIFAADFRDRVVHHYIFNIISPIFEKVFINDTYSCRKGKGTHYGIHRIDHFIRSCSENYRRDCYILKLDIRGYFMSMNRKLLFEKIKSVLMDRWNNSDFDLFLIIYLIEKTIFNDSTKNCIIKGKKSDWRGLPETKSLFHADPNCGLPIGNLTSQLFGNIYLSDFDHFVKRDLKIRYYGRYVDDFILVHQDREYLKSLIQKMREYLEEAVQLELHPKKIYLQHYSKGVKYLGAVIKPHRIYIAKRTKGNFYEAIEKQSRIARDHKPTREEQEQFRSSMNSYLGIMKHYKTYNIRKRMIFQNLSGWWWNYAYLSGGISKFVLG